MALKRYHSEIKGHDVWADLDGDCSMGLVWGQMSPTDDKGWFFPLNDLTEVKEELKKLRTVRIYECSHCKRRHKANSTERYLPSVCCGDEDYEMMWIDEIFEVEQ
jgi:hypothetical protein